MEQVLVYGSLKKGFGNHGVMERSGGEYIDNVVLEGNYTMLNLGAFPGVILEGNTPIHCELYKVKDMGPLDMLEGYPNFYDRRQVGTEYGPAWIYFLPREDYRNNEYGITIVEDGVWQGGRYSKSRVVGS